MNIHELNNFTGTLGSGAYLAIDDGTDTGKISSQGLLAATEARIDNIIAGPAPSAEEIVDARLGADGVTYPSLGDAIRDQFTDVKSALTRCALPPYSGHYYMSGDMIIRGGTDRTGNPTSSTTIIRNKGFVLVSKGSKIVLTPGTKCAQVVAIQFDINGTYIKDIGSWISSQFVWTSEIDGLYVFLYKSTSGDLLATDYDATTEIFTKEYLYLTNLIESYNAKKRQNAVAYVSGDNVGWSLSGTSDSVCALTIGDDIQIRTNTGVSNSVISIPKADVLSAASEYSEVTVSGSTITGSAFCIYYDFDTNNINVANSTNADCYKNTCIIFLHHWGSVTTGEIVRSVLSRKVKANEANISSLDNRVSALEGDDLPSYFIGEAETCASSLVDACNEKSLVIAFNTDNHYGASNGWNWGDTIGTIKKVNSLYPIDVIINGGDLINGDETKAKDIERLNEMISGMSKAKDCSYATIGNHDDGSFTVSETPLLSQGELFSTIARHMGIKSDAIAEQKSYCYKDFDGLGLRLIVLDSHISNGSGGATPSTWGYDTDQINWLSNVALDTNYQVVIFSHMGVTQEYSAANIQPVNGVAVRTAIESFIANGGVVVGFFHGHTHWDFIGKHSNTNGFYEISTGCSRIQTGPITLYSGYYPSGATMPVREAYTVTQELWDLIVVKPTSRKVKMIRFGAGDDREFTY